MSGVSPTDGGYNYYQKTIGELEDQVRAESKRNERKQDERVSSLEKKYQADLQDKQEHLDRTIQDIKKNSNEVVSRERDSAKSDVEAAKKSTYDRFGRFNGLEADTLSQELEVAKAAWEQQHAHDQQALLDAEGNFERKSEERDKDYSDRIDGAVRTTRQNVSEAYEKNAKDHNASYDMRKKELEAHYADLNQRLISETQDQGKRATQEISTAQDAFGQRIREEQESSGAQLAKVSSAYADTADTTTRNLRDSHEDETRVLRGELKNLSEARDVYKHGRGEGRADAIREYENDWRTRERTANEDYARNMDGLQHHLQETEGRFARLNQQSMNAKDEYFTNLIKQTNLDSREREKELDLTYDHSLHEVKETADKQKLLADTRAQSRINQAQEQKARDLLAQARTYQSQIDRTQLSNQNKLKTLQEELQVRSTSPDSSLIPAAAEEHLRNLIIADYEKKVAAQTDRDKVHTEGLAVNFQRNIEEITAQNQADKTRLVRENSSERQQERGDLLQEIWDTENTKNSTLRSQEQSHSRVLELTEKNHSQVLDRMRRQYDEILNSSRDDASAKLLAAREEAQFSSKMTQRAFSQRENEIIRGYEKKLADQKQDTDSVLTDIKSQAEVSVREADRRSRLALEENSRAYEQRIAQLEAQQQERERLVSQNYQEEMEKLKRSNALLIRKKS